MAYLNDIRGFPDAAFYPQLAKSSAKLVVMHSVQDGQADRREAPAGDIMDHIAAFFDARIAALTGAGIKRNRLVLDPGMGFFLGAAPETSLSVLARFDELRLRFDLPVLLSVSRKRAGGIGGAERNRKNSLTAHSGYFSIFAVQQACPL
ncbi:dihydropteroate synthase [Acinetobacter baumannii]|uniref:dihydropteroate synthase n=1 Tax=Acinetobacter baumannii TaxID=470 RepID=UPI0038CD4842